MVASLENINPNVSTRVNNNSSGHFVTSVNDEQSKNFEIKTTTLSSTSTTVANGTSSEKTAKTIVFVPLDSVGHINCTVCVANHFNSLGHRTVFLFVDPIKTELAKYGHEVYDCSRPGLCPSEVGDKDKWAEIVNNNDLQEARSPLEAFVDSYPRSFKLLMDDVCKSNEFIEAKLKLLKPDLIVVDHYMMCPAVYLSKVPWVRVFSANPISLHPTNLELPPAGSGMATNWDKTNQQYKQWLEIALKTKREQHENYQRYLTSKGLPELPTDPMSEMYLSPLLNIYVYPQELDYGPPPAGWIRADSMVRNLTITAVPFKADTNEQTNKRQVEPFQLPDKLKGKPGKLIYLSMGTLATNNVKLMTKIVASLAKCPHRFLVTTGQNSNLWQLADNMWGDSYLPQLQILPLVDLIITHGGNNTITECLYYGVKRLMVCPIFGDQQDNAQRIQEKQLGIRMDLYNSEEQELLEAIEKLLQDDDIPKRTSAIKDRMQLPENSLKGLLAFQEVLDKL